MSKALKAAIEANDPVAVRTAAKAVKDINRKLPGAKAPLLYACMKGADNVLEPLFEAGAIAEKRNTFPGDTPFAVAAEHRQFGVMKRLLALRQASDEAVRHVLENACMDGKADVLEFLLQEVKPRITIELFRLASVPSSGPALLKLLAKYGGDLNARHDTIEAQAMTPLHDLAGCGKPAVYRTLVEGGADVNSRDGLGRTPLMILAANIEGLEISNIHAETLKPLLESGEANLLAGEPPRVTDCGEAVRTLLELGADATLADHSGNDAIDHCVFEYFRSDKEPNPEVMALLAEAGAKGSKATLELFVALKAKNINAVRVAIAHGADVNRLTPPPVPFTPLTWAAGSSAPDALETVRALLASGADPNKPNRQETPLMQAASRGNLSVVKELVAAGADIGAVRESGECIENAYSAAAGHDAVRDYLKSLGAGNPVRAHREPLKPGVGSWNDFSELLVKTTADLAAAALAKMIDGKAHLNIYGQSFIPGERAFLVLRPKGMDWCNVFQIAPPRLRFEDTEKREAFAVELARVCAASVLLVDYSDTADAASILRIEPTGEKTRDAGWDRDTLEEMVGALGSKAPAWAKRQLAKADEDEPRSTERLEMLAEQEKFLVATIGLYCEPGRRLDVEFTGYGAEAFDGVAFVGD